MIRVFMFMWLRCATSLQFYIAIQCQCPRPMQSIKTNFDLVKQTTNDPIRKRSASVYVLLGHFQQAKRIKSTLWNTFLRIYCCAKWIEFFLSIINYSKPFSWSVSETEFIRLSNLFVLIISIYYVCSCVLCVCVCVWANERARTFLSADSNVRQNLLNLILSLSF